MTIDELEAIEKRANAATAGPWRMRLGKCEGGAGLGSTIWETYAGFENAFVDTDAKVLSSPVDDCRFIANARTDIADLIAWVRTLEEANKQLSAKIQHNNFTEQRPWLADASKALRVAATENAIERYR